MSQNQQSAKTSSFDEAIEKFEINRSVLTKKAFDNTYKRNPLLSPVQKLNDKFSRLRTPTIKSVGKQFNKRIPGFKMLIDYDFKNNILSDIVSGITITVMQVTQGNLF